MDIQKMIERENNYDGIYLYTDDFQLKAFGFSAFMLTRMFPKLQMEDKLFQEGEAFLPFLTLCPKFLADHFPDCMKTTNDEYTKVNCSELYKSGMLPWKEEYESYMIEQQKANNKLGSCVLGFFRLG